MPSPGARNIGCEGTATGVAAETMVETGALALYIAFTGTVARKVSSSFFEST